MQLSNALKEFLLLVCVSVAPSYPGLRLLCLWEVRTSLWLCCQEYVPATVCASEQMGCEMIFFCVVKFSCLLLSTL